MMMLARDARQDSRLRRTRPRESPPARIRIYIEAYRCRQFCNKPRELFIWHIFGFYLYFADSRGESRHAFSRAAPSYLWHYWRFSGNITFSNRVTPRAYRKIMYRLTSFYIAHVTGALMGTPRRHTCITIPRNALEYFYLTKCHRLSDDRVIRDRSLFFQSILHHRQFVFGRRR